MLDTPIHLPGAGSTADFFPNSHWESDCKGSVPPSSLAWRCSRSSMSMQHSILEVSPKNTHIYTINTYIYTIYTINVQYHTDMVAPRTSLFIRIDIFWYLWLLFIKIYVLFMGVARTLQQASHSRPMGDDLQGLAHQLCASQLHNVKALNHWFSWHNLLI